MVTDPLACYPCPWSPIDFPGAAHSCAITSDHYWHTLHTHTCAVNGQVEMQLELWAVMEARVVMPPLFSAASCCRPSGPPVAMEAMVVLLPTLPRSQEAMVATVSIRTACQSCTVICICECLPIATAKIRYICLDGGGNAGAALCLIQKMNMKWERLCSLWLSHCMVKTKTAHTNYPNCQAGFGLFRPAEGAKSLYMCDRHNQ